MRKTLGALTLSLWLVVVMSASADAAGSFSWTTRWVDDTSGAAQAKVSQTFISQRTVETSGWVNDLCPADGKSAELWIGVSEVGKSSWNLRREYYDSRRCDAAGVVYFGPVRMSVPVGKKLDRIVYQLCERDIDGSGTDRCETRSFTNWRLG